MYEKFTFQARRVVVHAQEEARAMGHRFIGTEHLLLGMLHDDSGTAATVLAAEGLRPEGVRTRIRRLLAGEDGGLEEGDAEALRSIGIDLDSVRTRVERTFGPGALDPPVPEPKHGFLRRSGPRSGHIPFSGRAKTVLDLAVRESSGPVGSEHLLLGLLREGQGLAAKVLVDAGLDLAELRRRVIDRAA